MEGEEIIKEKRIPMTISVDPSLKKELLKVKEIDSGRISMSGLIEFFTVYPYSLGDFIVSLEVLRSIPEEKKRLIMCFYRRDYKEAAKIIREVLDTERKNEIKLEDAIHYIKNRKGENSLIEKKIQEVEDNIADLKIMIKTK